MEPSRPPSVDAESPRRELISKICVLGDAASGKTPLLRPHVGSSLPDRYITTIGTKVTKKTLFYERQFAGRTVRFALTLLVWDILGQKQYSRLHPVYYQGAEGAVIVSRFDAPDPSGSMRAWAASFAEIVGPRPIVFALNTGRASAPAHTSWSTALLRDFPGASFMIVSPDEPSAMGQALTEIGARILDAGLAARPELLDPRPIEPPRTKRRWLHRRR